MALAGRLSLQRYSVPFRGQPHDQISNRDTTGATVAGREGPRSRRPRVWQGSQPSSARGASIAVSPEAGGEWHAATRSSQAAGGRPGRLGDVAAAWLIVAGLAILWL